LAVDIGGWGGIVGLAGVECSRGKKIDVFAMIFGGGCRWLGMGTELVNRISVIVKGFVDDAWDMAALVQKIAGTVPHLALLWT
jgi:hypothetical protein